MFMVLERHKNIPSLFYEYTYSGVPLHLTLCYSDNNICWRPFDRYGRYQSSRRLAQFLVGKCAEVASKLL